MPESLHHCRACGASLGVAEDCVACALESALLAAPEDCSADAAAFASFTLRREIAAGGMGVVYEAWQPALKRTVAPKMMRGAFFAGELYGSTHRGGPDGGGTVFRVGRRGAWSMPPAKLRDDLPATHLMARGDDGWLYGQAYVGKSCTLWRVKPGSEAFETISYQDEPWRITGFSGLVADGRGGFLNVNKILGPQRHGGIFRLQTDGNFQVLAQFTGQTGDLPGSRPVDELLPVTRDGVSDFYGACPQGGASDRGVIYKVSPDGKAKMLVEF